MRKKSFILISVVIICVFSVHSFAGRIWYHSPIGTDNNPIQGTDSAIGMRSSSHSWPVAASGGPGGSSAALTPAGWVRGTFSLHERIDGATADDGTVGFADRYANIGLLTRNGWAAMSYPGEAYETPSIAFTSGSSPAVLHNNIQNGDITLSVHNGSGWISSTVENYQFDGFGTDSYALDFDSYDNANIAFYDGGMLWFGVNGVITGNQWQLSDPANNPQIGSADYIDAAVTSGDMFWASYSDNQNLGYAVYDTQTASITSGIIDNTLYSESFSMAADENGGVGIAYVADHQGTPTLSFAYNDGSGIWNIERIHDADPYRVGLTFDYDNNPVISYSYMGDLRMAYDPVVTPEPATALILAVGGFFIKRRK